MSKERLASLSKVLGGKKIGAPKLCTLKKLSAICPSIGHALDDADATWGVIRWVVHGKGVAVQRERAIASIAELVASREARNEPSAMAKEVVRFLEETSAELMIEAMKESKATRKAA